MLKIDKPYSIEMRVHDYMFYKIYKLINFLGNKDFYPEANTWFICSMFLWFNLLTILNFAELKLGKALTSAAYVIVFYILYLVLTYIYFFRKERYKKILQAYDKQTGIKKIWGTISVTIYILLTLTFHFYLSEQRRAMALSMK